jgi:uncharacterized lipoprotein YajG
MNRCRTLSLIVFGLLAFLAGCATGRQSARVQAEASAMQDQPAMARVGASWEWTR